MRDPVNGRATAVDDPGGPPPGRELDVLIVDDHHVFSDLLEFAINCSPGLRCAGKAATPAEALELYRRVLPDVVVMDLQLGPGEAEGLALTRQLLQVHPEAHVLVLTALRNHHLAVEAARSGAVGFLQKDGSIQTVITALRSVNEGYLMIDPHLLTEDVPRTGTSDLVPALSPRELDVLRLVGAGVRPAMVAKQLDISLHTVKSHLSSLKRKLDTHTQLETVTRAVALGLIPSPGDQLTP